ncbi:MAG: YfhO family protein, partial [Bacilli bacterium]|nr:YfhO family protein [Bacilli bacterium]
FNLMGVRFLSVREYNLFYFNWYALLTIPYNLTIGAFVPTDNWSAGSTIIYSSVLVLVLIVYYFANKKIPRKNKLLTIGLFAFFAISFSFLLLDYSWNMLQRPLGWSHRYQFVLVFLLIILAYESFVNLEDAHISKKAKLIITILFVIVVGLSFVYKYKASGLVLPNGYILMVVLSMILFTIYINHLKWSPILLLLVVLELSVNIYDVLMFSTVRYQDAQERISAFDKQVQAVESTSDYRIVNLGNFVNYNTIAGYNSIEIFSSSHNVRILNFVQKTGISEEYMNTAEIDELNPAVLSLLGLKYYFVEGTLGYFNCYDGICEDKYAMPYMFGVNDTLKDVTLSDDYVKNVNNIYSSLLGKKVELMRYVDANCAQINKMKLNDDRMLYEIDDDNATVSINYEAEKREMIIFNSGLMGDLQKSVRINDKEVDEWSYYKIVLNKGDNLTLDIDYSFALENKFDNYLFSLLDLDLYEEAIESLVSKAKYQNTHDNKYILKGIVNTEIETIMINIPYTEGLVIKVDGKKSEYFPLMETFVGVSVLKGQHEVTVEYKPRGLNSGIIISTLASLFMIGKVIRDKKMKKKKAE